MQPHPTFQQDIPAIVRHIYFCQAQRTTPAPQPQRLCGILAELDSYGSH